jgi:hypothetical protein
MTSTVEMLSRVDEATKKKIEEKVFVTQSRHAFTSQPSICVPRIPVSSVTLKAWRSDNVKYAAAAPGFRAGIPIQLNPRLVAHPDRCTEKVVAAAEPFTSAHHDVAIVCCILPNVPPLHMRPHGYDTVVFGHTWPPLGIPAVVAVLCATELNARFSTKVFCVRKVDNRAARSLVLAPGTILVRDWVLSCLQLLELRTCVDNYMRLKMARGLAERCYIRCAASPTTIPAWISDIIGENASVRLWLMTCNGHQRRVQKNKFAQSWVLGRGHPVYFKRTVAIALALELNFAYGSDSFEVASGDVEVGDLKTKQDVEDADENNEDTDVEIETDEKTDGDCSGGGGGDCSGDGGRGEGKKKRKDAPDAATEAVEHDLRACFKCKRTVNVTLAGEQSRMDSIDRKCLMCMGCSSQWYCGRKCQIADFARHRIECSLFREYKKETPPPMTARTEYWTIEMDLRTQTLEQASDELTVSFDRPPAPKSAAPKTATSLSRSSIVGTPSLQPESDELPTAIGALWRLSQLGNLESKQNLIENGGYYLYGIFFGRNTRLIYVRTSSVVVAGIREALQSRTCSSFSCLKFVRGKPMVLCDACHSVHYCSAHCMRLSKEAHALECQLMQRVTSQFARTAPYWTMIKEARSGPKALQIALPEPLSFVMYRKGALTSGSNGKIDTLRARKVRDYLHTREQKDANLHARVQDSWKSFVGKCKDESQKITSPTTSHANVNGDSVSRSNNSPAIARTSVSHPPPKAHQSRETTTMMTMPVELTRLVGATFSPAPSGAWRFYERAVGLAARCIRSLSAVRFAFLLGRCRRVTATHTTAIHVTAAVSAVPEVSLVRESQIGETRQILTNDLD